MDLTLPAFPTPIVPNFYESEKKKRSFFPGKPQFFICLEMALGHFGHFKAAAENQPKLSKGVGRYFPVFWDGSTDWLTIDVKPSNQNRVLLVATRSKQPIREAYGSFDEFIADAIRANAENKPLRCFQKFQRK